MSRSNSSNYSFSSPGFVYFNTSNNTSGDNSQPYANPADTSDFLAFSDTQISSPPSNRFSPSNYSSPQKFKRGSPQSQRGSPRGYYNNRGHRNNRFSGGNFNSPYNNYNSSPNSSYNNSNQNNSWNRNNQNRHKSFGGQQKQSITKFIDMSCLKDPWKELEEEMNREQQQNDISSENTSNAPKGSYESDSGEESENTTDT